MTFYYSLPKLPAGTNPNFSGTDPFATDSQTGFGSPTSLYDFKAGPTPRQLAQIKYNAEHQHHDSFLDRVKHSAGFTLDHALDILSRGNYASATAMDKFIGNYDSNHSLLHSIEAAGHGAVAGVKGNSKETFSDVISHSHTGAADWLNKHKWVRGGVALADDIALDPTSYIGLGLVAKGGKAVKIGETFLKGEKLAEAAAVGSKAEKAIAHADRLEAGLRDAIEQGGHEASRAEAQATINRITAATVDEGVAEAARVEAKRALYVRFGPTKRTSLYVRTPLTVRHTQLEKIAKLSEAAKGGKFTAEIRSAVKNKLHNGWDIPVIHRMKQATLIHGLRKVAEGHWRYASEKLEPFLDKKSATHMTTDEQARALSAFDKTGVVDKKTADIIQPALEEQLTKQGFVRGTGTLQTASAFLHAWHDVTGRLMHYNEAAGVPLEEGASYAWKEGRGYVPRRTFSGTAKKIASREVGKVQRFQKTRDIHGLDFEGILNGIKDGSIDPHQVVADPHELLATVVNESSKAQMLATFKKAVRTMGIETKVFDRHLADNEYSKQLEAKSKELTDVEKRLALTSIEHVTKQAVDHFNQTRDANAVARRTTGNELKKLTADMERTTPLGRLVKRMRAQDIGKLKSTTPEAQALQKRSDELGALLTKAEKPLEGGELAAVGYENEQQIDKLREAKLYAETPEGPGFGSAAESPVYARSGTAEGPIRQAWDKFHAQALQPHEADALDYYVNDSGLVSEYLMDNMGILDNPVGQFEEGMVSVIRDLDQAFRKAPPAPKSFTVFHGAQYARKLGEKPTAGGVYDIDTFLSTSTDKRVADIWSGDTSVEHPAFGGSNHVADGYAAANMDGAEPFPAVYEINVPKGARTIGNIAGTAHASVDEVVLPRGGKLRVRSVTYDDKGIAHVKGDWIPPKDATKSLDPTHIDRQIKRLEAAKGDPAALKRLYRSPNWIKGQKAIVDKRLAALHAAAKDKAPDGIFKNVRWKFGPAHPGGRGIKSAGRDVLFTIPDAKKGTKGFARVFLDRNGYAHIGTIHVLPAHQGKGLGRDLYTAITAMLEDRGGKGIVQSGEGLLTGDGQRMWKRLEAKPPVGWEVKEEEDGTKVLVRDPQANIKRARTQRQINVYNRYLESLPPASQVRKAHLVQLSKIATDPERVKSEAELTARAKVLKEGIEKLRPKRLAAMYKDNPKAMREDLIHSVELDAEGIGGLTHGYVLPAHMAAGVDRVVNALTHPHEMDKLDRIVRKSMTEWKKLVTSVNPGYWTRNTMSDFWNMYISGVPLWGISRYSVRAAHVMRAAKKGDRKALRILEEFELRGGGSGLFVGDIRQMKAELAHEHGLYARATGKMVDFNGARENWGRLIHFLYRNEREGMSFAQAARHVREAHFDYTDLTEFEQRVMKGIVPFYTWTRKNLPFQLRMMATNPGRVATYQKVASESEASSGPGYNGPLGVALAGKPLAFRLGANYVNPQIGLQDLFQANPLTEEGRQGLIGMMNPALKTAFELGTNRSTFSGQPIYGDKARAPTGPQWLSDVLGTGSGMRDYGKGSQAYPEIPWWADYAARQVPLGSYLLSRDNPAASARSGDAYGGLDPKTISYAFGLSVGTVNPDYERMVAKMNADENFKVYYKWLQDKGAAPLSNIQDPSYNQQRVDRSSAAAYGRSR